jgi:plastocyanin
LDKENDIMKQAMLSAVTAVVVALALGLSKGSQAGPAPNGQKTSNEQYQVRIDNFSFGPATLTVPVGATVAWTNQDDVPHTVVSTDGKDIKSPVLDTDQKFTHTFAQAGTYAYYCSIHPKMTGKVIVQ